MNKLDVPSEIFKNLNLDPLNPLNVDLEKYEYVDTRAQAQQYAAVSILNEISEKNTR